MKLKPAILAALSRERLKKIVDDLGLPDVDRRSGDTMREALARSRRVTADELLAYLDQAALQPVCQEVGIPSKGSRDELVERLLASGDHQAAQPRSRAVDERDGKQGNGRRKLDVSAPENWLKVPNHGKLFQALLKAHLK
jgi:hypothetical protein